MRQLFTISYTLAPEKYLKKLHNNIVWYTNVSLRQISVMYNKKYLDNDILKYKAI